MKGRVVSEHRRLEDLFETMIDACASSQSSDETWKSFEQLSEELLTHIEQEDHLYFPAIWALCPEVESALRELGRGHAQFIELLRQIGDHLSHGDDAGAARVLRTLDETFRAHEQSEERVLSRLDSELGI